MIFFGNASIHPFLTRLQTAPVDTGGSDLKMLTETHHLQKSEMKPWGFLTGHSHVCAFSRIVEKVANYNLHLELAF